jgi:hypothetical protein
MHQIEECRWRPTVKSKILKIRMELSKRPKVLMRESLEEVDIMSR